MKPTQQTQDRRQSRRKREQTRITLHVTDQHLAGSAESVTKSGVLFHTDGSLEVEIEVEEDGVLRTRKGRLIRTERVSEARQGWAVEFDD